MKNVLMHELLKVQPGLGKINGKINSTSKLGMITILSSDVETPPSVPDGNPTQWACVLIVGHALIQSLGNPINAHTFNNYTEICLGVITSHVTTSVKRVDIVFDTYMYIKQQAIRWTRDKRTGKKR